MSASGNGYIWGVTIGMTKFIDAIKKPYSGQWLTVTLNKLMHMMGSTVAVTTS